VRVYLDNCTLNRPFDDQSQARIRLETEAKLCLQEQVRKREIELAWSYILDFENAANPFNDRQTAIGKWKDCAVCDVGETASLLRMAEDLGDAGLKASDALHVACAIAAKCDHFVTADDRIIGKCAGLTEITVIDPTALVRELDL